MVNTDNENKYSVEYQQLIAFIPKLYKKIKSLESRVSNIKNNISIKNNL